MNSSVGFEQELEKAGNSECMGHILTDKLITAVFRVENRFFKGHIHTKPMENIHSDYEITEYFRFPFDDS